MKAKRSVLSGLVTSGVMQTINDLSSGIQLVTAELEGKGTNAADAQQIKQINAEIKQIRSVEKLQSYVFNSYLKYNGMGVIR